MTDWFEEWFGEEYLQLYPHRNEEDARAVVSLIARVLPWQRGWRVLDVACGAGRHLQALTAAGAAPIGLDLSATLLRRARQVTPRPLVRADMRALPVRPGTMDLTVNLFTSFGYFANDREHAGALREMISTVRPGGWFVLDFLNPGRIRATMVADERSTIGERTVRVRRQITADDRFVVKTITTEDGRDFRERVRLLEPSDLESMMRHAGAEPVHRFGDYAGGELGPGPRTILFARRAA
jgi:SAM-dependent methyltransferase